MSLFIIIINFVLGCGTVDIDQIVPPWAIQDVFRWYIPVIIGKHCVNSGDIVGHCLMVKTISVAVGRRHGAIAGWEGEARHFDYLSTNGS